MLPSQKFIIVQGRDVFVAHTLEEGRAAAREIVAHVPISVLSDELGLPADPAAAMEQLAYMLASGRFSLVRTARAPRLVDPPNYEPLVPPNDDPIPPPVDRPTWISIAVVHEQSGTFAGVPLALVAPDGSNREGRLDADGCWRVDDVPQGTCSLWFTEGLGDTYRVDGPRAPHEPDDPWVGRSAGAPIRLVTTRAHRLVVVEGRTEIRLQDADGRPLSRHRCRVAVGPRAVEGRTDDEGCWALDHPGSLQAGEVILEDLHPSLVRQTGTEEVGR